MNGNCFCGKFRKTKKNVPVAPCNKKANANESQNHAKHNSNQISTKKDKQSLNQANPVRHKINFNPSRLSRISNFNYDQQRLNQPKPNRYVYNILTNSRKIETHTKPKVSETHNKEDKQSLNQAKPVRHQINLNPNYVNCKSDFKSDQQRSIQPKPHRSICNINQNLSKTPTHTKPKFSKTHNKEDKQVLIQYEPLPFNSNRNNLNVNSGNAKNQNQSQMDSKKNNSQQRAQEINYKPRNRTMKSNTNQDKLLKHSQNNIKTIKDPYKIHSASYNAHRKSNIIKHKINSADINQNATNHTNYRPMIKINKTIETLIDSSDSSDENSFIESHSDVHQYIIKDETKHLSQNIKNNNKWISDFDNKKSINILDKSDSQIYVNISNNQSKIGDQVFQANEINSTQIPDSNNDSDGNNSEIDTYIADAEEKKNHDMYESVDKFPENDVYIADTEMHALIDKPSDEENQQSNEIENLKVKNKLQNFSEDQSDDYFLPKIQEDDYKRLSVVSIISSDLSIGGVHGFQNPKGYCFLNSVIQVLRSCKKFHKAIIKYHKESKIQDTKETDDNKTTFVIHFCTLLHKLKENDNVSIQLDGIQNYFLSSSSGDDVNKCYMNLLSMINNVIKNPVSKEWKLRKRQRKKV